MVKIKRIEHGQEILQNGTISSDLVFYGRQCDGHVRLSWTYLVVVNRSSFKQDPRRPDFDPKSVNLRDLWPHYFVIMRIRP